MFGHIPVVVPAHDGTVQHRLGHFP